MVRLVLVLVLFPPLVLAQDTTLTLTKSEAWRAIPLAGYVEATRDTTLLTNRMAEVVALPIQPGSHVRQGTVLIRLEDKALQQQRAALAQAESAQRAALEQAELQAGRMQRLLDKGAVAGVQAEQALLQVAAAKAELNHLTAQARQLKEMASYLEITAKSDGQLTELNIGLGDIASPGQPLGHFVGQDIRALKVMVPAHVYQGISAGQWQVQAAGNEDWTAVSLISQVPIADARTSQHPVYLSVPAGLLPNQSVRVHLLLPSEGLFVPEQAIHTRGNLTYVQVRTPQGIEKRLVRLGLPFPDGRRQVQAGLSEGDVLALREDHYE